jgi:protein TonB
MVAALGFNGSILAALILIPLIYPSMLPLQPIPYLIAALQPPKGAVPLAHRTVTQASPTAARNILDELQAPRHISPTIFIASSPEPRDIVGIPGGDPRLDGNTPGGVGDETFHHAAPAVHSEPKSIRVSSGTEEGLIVFQTIPQYPVIAKTMRVEGTVELAATISKAGTIENLRVTSGPVMLQQAALDAVKTWRYRPYMLDGAPVEVETSVEVVFKIQH